MKKQNLVHLQVRMDEEVHKKLKETAKKMGLNTSQLMRQIINEFVENPKSKVVFKK
jgi:antitoxin component of RelBE/YafQ-DinJ toxin-antitoxin module